MLFLHKHHLASSAERPPRFCRASNVPAAPGTEMPSEEGMMASGSTLCKVTCHAGFWLVQYIGPLHRRTWRRIFLSQRHKPSLASSLPHHVVLLRILYWPFDRL